MAAPGYGGPTPAPGSIAPKKLVEFWDNF